MGAKTWCGHVPSSTCPQARLYVVTYGVLSSDRQMEEMPKDDPFGLRNQSLNSEMLVVDCTPNFHTSKVPMNKTKVKIDVIWHKDW